MFDSPAHGDASMPRRERVGFVLRGVSVAPRFHICELTWTLACTILDVWRRGAGGGLILGVVVKTVTSRHA